MKLAKDGCNVLDIGSNDGTCLKFFKEKGMKVVGVDPAKGIAKMATKTSVLKIVFIDRVTS